MGFLPKGDANSSKAVDEIDPLPQKLELIESDMYLSTEEKARKRRDAVAYAEAAARRAALAAVACTYVVYICVRLVCMMCAHRRIVMSNMRSALRLLVDGVMSHQLTAAICAGSAVPWRVAMCNI